MNIKLTLTEATELIRAALKVPKHQTLTVQIFVENHPTAIILDGIRKEFPRYFADQKISAIKKFRELTPGPTDSFGRTVSMMGLAESKWAIENLDQAIDNLNKYGKLQL